MTDDTLTLDEDIFIEALRNNVSMRMKTRRFLEEVQHHKDNNHFELHTDWIINKLKEILE